MITGIEGEVTETVRPYYELIGQESEGATYSLEDLGLSDDVPVFGLEAVKSWKYLTLRLRAAYFQADADSTATRDYYIGISNDIEYQGREYDHMMIPSGDPFTASLDSGLCHLDFLITPVSFRPDDSLEIVPWIYLGLVGVFGQYDLDAGPARGTTTYEDPPVEYVIGGQTDGWAGVGVPALGVGGEMTLGRSDGVRLVLSGNWSIFRYDGSTEYFPIETRHEKDLTLNYDNYELAARLEFPLSDSMDFFLGGAYVHYRFDGELNAKERDPEDIEELREKFDKVFDFRMSSLTGFAGIRF